MSVAVRVTNTGSRSGDVVVPVYASQPQSVSREDGLTLSDAWISASVRCAPPDNKPTPDEVRTCRKYLERELELLTELRVVVCLGAFAYQAACAELAVRPRPKFGHGVEVDAPNGLHLLCSFHPSQQNTFTGRLTEAMLDDVFSKALALSG